MGSRERVHTFVTFFFNLGGRDVSRYLLVIDTLAIKYTFYTNAIDMYSGVYDEPIYGLNTFCEYQDLLNIIESSKYNQKLIKETSKWMLYQPCKRSVAFDC